MPVWVRFAHSQYGHGGSRAAIGRDLVCRQGSIGAGSDVGGRHRAAGVRDQSYRLSVCKCRRVDPFSAVGRGGGAEPSQKPQGG